MPLNIGDFLKGEVKTGGTRGKYDTYSAMQAEDKKVGKAQGYSYAEVGALIGVKIPIKTNGKLDMESNEFKTVWNQMKRLRKQYKVIRRESGGVDYHKVATIAEADAERKLVEGVPTVQGGK